MNHRHSNRALVRTAQLAAVLVATAGAVGAQSIIRPMPSALAGVVSDTAGNPIPKASVEAENVQITSVTDDSGRFHVRGITAGRNDFTVRRLGYRAVAFSATLAPDTTLILIVRMTPVAALDPVTVAAEGSVRLHRVGFYERRNVGLGSFLTPEDLAPLANLPQASLMMVAASVRGVQRECEGATTYCDLQFRTAPCRWLFIDQVQVEGVLDELVSPTEIAAVEVYDRATNVPTSFHGHLHPRAGEAGHVTNQLNCGAIAVWTRIRAGLK